MTKTQKELAFLREIDIDAGWTERFTDFADKNIKFTGKEKKFLYINAGTGNHALALREKINAETEVFATVENNHFLNIARDKAAAVKSKVEFSTRRFKDESFDAVLADASFTRPAELRNLFEEAARLTETGGKIADFTVTAGSFGEIFSYLWEIFSSDDSGKHGAEAEKLIAGLPTASKLEEIAESANLKNVASQTSREIFEYKNGAEFINSALVENFLLPVWLKFLTEKQKERVRRELAQLIDAEDGTLSFRFSVKATLITGEKS